MKTTNKGICQFNDNMATLRELLGKALLLDLDLERIVYLFNEKYKSKIILSSEENLTRDIFYEIPCEYKYEDTDEELIELLESMSLEIFYEGECDIYSNYIIFDSRTIKKFCEESLITHERFEKEVATLDFKDRKLSKNELIIEIGEHLCDNQHWGLTYEDLHIICSHRKTGKSEQKVETAVARGKLQFTPEI